MYRIRAYIIESSDCAVVPGVGTVCMTDCSDFRLKKYCNGSSNKNLGDHGPPNCFADGAKEWYW